MREYFCNESECTETYCPDRKRAAIVNAAGLVCGNS